jgi:hypothetical protein
MIANTFAIASLPQTHPVPVTDLTFTDLFATTTAVVTVLDTDGVLRSTLRFMPDHSRLSFEVADASKGFRFKNATLLMLEMAVGDEYTSMMWSTEKDNVTPIGIGAATE